MTDYIDFEHIEHIKWLQVPVNNIISDIAFKFILKRM